MSTDEDENEEYFLRASLLLLKGGGLMSKETLSREMAKPGKNLDERLKTHKGKLKHKFSREQRNKLWPDGGTTCVEQWDLALLTTVPLTVFKETLSSNEKAALKCIKYKRDTVYAHTHSTVLSFDDYDDIRKELVEALRVLSNGSSDSVKDECAKIIKQCTTGPISPSVKAELSKQLKDTEDLVKAVMTKLTDTHKAVLEMRKEIIERLERLEERSPNLDRHEKIIKVIYTELTLSGAVNENDDIDFVDEIVTRVINKAIKKVGNDDYPKIHLAVKNILTEIENIPDVKILPAKSKCILLQFECTTYTSILKLLRYLESESFMKLLKELASAVNTDLPDAKEIIRADATVTTECMTELLDILRAKTPTRSTRSIRMQTEVQTVHGVKHIWSLFDQGGVTNALDELSEAVSDELKQKITIKPSINVVQVYEALNEADIQSSRSMQESQVAVRYGAHHHENIESGSGKHATETTDSLQELSDADSEHSGTKLTVTPSLNIQQVTDAFIDSATETTGSLQELSDAVSEHSGTKLTVTPSLNIQQVTDAFTDSGGSKQDIGTELTQEHFDCPGEEEWMSFLYSGKKKIARKLVKLGHLPKQGILDEISLLFGRKSKVTLMICNAICAHIKAKDERIIDVWAAYTLQNINSVTFVVSFEELEKTGKEDQAESIRLDKMIDYSFVKRRLGEYSYESTEIINQNVTSGEDFDDDTYGKLQTCVAKYSVKLMKEHKYLSVVSACSKRSSGYGSSWNLKPEYCIVLYVHTKHYIPINEDPFKTFYDGIPVDVREGAFIPFGKTATDVLDHVQMGCQIRGEVENDKYVEGTLGFFIDHPQYGVCGLTCAHVLLSPWDLTRLKTVHNGTYNWPLHDMRKTVFQPANQTDDIGHTVQLIYKEGSENSSGMEVALFKLTNRHPKSSDFPDASVTVASTTTTNINYEHWRICSADRLNSKMKHVIKFGSKTELRAGIIEFGTMAVKELNSFPLLSGSKDEIKLHRQIEVKPQNTSFAFAAEGDSGALVFLVGDNSSEHTCIGIVEGGTTYGTVVVTPIVPILEELKVSGLKSFDSENILVEIHAKIENVAQTLTNEIQRMQTEMQGMNRDIQNIVRGLQDVHTVTSEVQNVSGDMKTFGTEMQIMRGDIKAIGSELQEVQTIRSNMQQIQQLLQAIIPSHQSPTSPKS